MALLSKPKTAEAFTVPADLAPFYSDPTGDEIAQRLTELLPSAGGKFTFDQMRDILRNQRLAQAQAAATADAKAKAQAEASKCVVCGYPFGQPRYGFNLCGSCEQLADLRVREQRLAMLTDVQRRHLDDIASRFIADHP